MSQLLLQVLSILTEPSGDLIFHLVQIFSALAALLLALSSHQDPKSSIYRRFLLGIIIVLGGQLMLFLITTFGWRGYFDTHLILPILDRTVNSICMVWIIWLWVAPLPWKVADYSLAGFNIFIGLSFLVTGFTWFIQGSGMDFNSTWQDLLWADLMVVAIVAGLIGLIYKKPDGWGVGVGFLAINLTGLTAHLVYPMQPGDYVGLVRLVQVFTYPLLPVLTRRFTLPPAPAIFNVPPPVQVGQPERTRFTAESRTIDTWLQLSAQERSEPFHKLLVKAIAQTMVADICLLISVPDPQKQVRINAGYDLIRQETLGEGKIKGENIPEILRAFDQNLPLILLTGGPISKDLKSFRDILNLKAPSNSMFIPILYHQEPIAGLLLCSPYSSRIWDITDESYLYSVTNRVGALLAEISKREEDLVSDDLATLDEEALRKKYSLLKQENIALVTEIDVLQKNPELPPETVAPQLEPPAVIALPAVISVPDTNNQRMSIEEEENLRTELRIALEEVSRLRATQAAVVVSASIAETMTDEKKNGVEEDFQTEKANQAISNSAGETADEMPELEGEVITPVMEDPDLNRDTSIPMMDLSLLTSMVDESIQDNRDVLAQHEISLLSDIPADTPRILALPSQAGSVISRILRNFVENSPTGSSITINAVPDGEFVNLHLKHSIDPENAANLGPGNVEETITYPYGFAREDWEQVVKQISTFNGEVLFNPIPPNQEEVTIKFRTA
jgi:hypothetical protein